MDRIALLKFARDAVNRVPQVKAHLSDKVRFILATPSAYKTQEYFLAQIQGLVRTLYNGQIGGEFIDVMANVISGQIYDAYSKAWIDEGGTGNFPDYLESSYQDFVTNQYSFVDQYYRDIVDARIDNTSIEPLLLRAELWANQYGTAYENATTAITLAGGGNEEWILGATEEHCPECSALNGFVMRASEWEALNLRPKNPPNNKISCGGWRCDCERKATSKKRSPNAYGRIEEILLAKS